jgi:uncharacterized protein (UPF0261 family)
VATILLIGTLDTKGAEYAYVRDRLTDAGADTVVVDVGVQGEPGFRPDVTREQVASAAGADVVALAEAGDRGAAAATMARGAAEWVAKLHREGRCDAALALGGTGGTSLASQAMRVLPLGVPKVIVSTVASGDTGPYIGESDLVLMPSVVDIAGVNRLSARILSNAAASVAGMATMAQPPDTGTRPVIAASMFGVTTPCVTAARERLEELGYEVLVFHMTGAGGRTLESLAHEGYLAGVLDITTTELADELVGGVFSAGAKRLTGAAAAGVPQVVSVGALDMVNFGRKDTVPPQFADRNLYLHNPNVTLMRTTPSESAELGKRLAERVSAATAPATVFLPLRGVSSIATEGGPFHDAAADEELFSAIRQHLNRGTVEIVEIDEEINDPHFARAMAERLHQMVKAAAR